MKRFLAAWAWLRWRTFMNAIERSHRADRFTRLTRATEALGPIVMMVLMGPSALAAMALGAAAGYGMGSGAPWSTPLMHTARVVLFLVLVLTVLGPLLLPSGRGLASLPRLLLLPVPHRTIFVGELLGGFAEPWTLAGTLIAIGVAIGAIVSGNAGAALVAVVGAVALIAALLTVGALFGALLHLVMRNRKRGEWIVVAFMTVIPLLAMLPALLAGAGAPDRVTRQERERAFEARLARMTERPAAGALALFPGELFVASVARASGLVTGSAILPLAGLAMGSAASAGAAWSVWKRTINRGGISRGRGVQQQSASTSRWVATPGRAIAFTFLHHAIRTARGRLTILPSLVATVIVGTLIMSEGGLDFGRLFTVQGGFGLAMFGVFMAFLSAVQLWVNQFAIDRAGLTLLCLQPVSAGAILRGKMLGAAVVIAATAALPFGVGMLIGADVPAVYWVLLVLGGAAGFLVLAPLAAILAIFFPKHVDLSSIGQKSNAHPAGGLLGGLLVAAVSVPAFTAAMAGTKYFGSLTAAVALSLGWLVIAFGLHTLLFRLAVHGFERRREALLLAAAGR